MLTKGKRSKGRIFDCYSTLICPLIYQAENWDLDQKLNSPKTIFLFFFIIYFVMLCLFFFIFDLCLITSVIEIYLQLVFFIYATFLLFVTRDMKNCYGLFTSSIRSISPKVHIISLWSYKRKAIKMIGSFSWEGRYRNHRSAP